MDNTLRDEIYHGLNTAYLDSSVASNPAYRPQFISNNYHEGKKVLSSIEDELHLCDSFKISVAFITMSGVAPLLQTLHELEEKGIPGEILTTNYLAFSEPKALRLLYERRNLKIKIYDVDAAGEGFHTKGYIFKKDEVYRFIIGSSNITSTALTSNKEWNTKTVSTENGEIAKEILNEYQSLWTSKYAKPYEDYIEEYTVKYNIIKHQREVAKEGNVISIPKYTLKPNSMQNSFIANLKKFIDQGASRALLISATGTGKTYASAFAMRELGYKRVLFLVHRNQLAKQAKQSFERVFDSSVSMGLVGAGYDDYDKDYVFATRDTLYREAHLKHYKPTDFDCIILDEAHHSAADTYQRIMNYFQPKLWLGMTATPDKRDDFIEERNIYKLFNYNIACEIRLQQAMEEDLLCPFHYFGISDLSMIGDEQSKSRKLSVEEFRLLVSDVYALKDDEFRKQINDIIQVGLRRYDEKYKERSESGNPFILYEKYSRRDVSLLMNCGRDLSSTMYGMKRINDDAFIFITYHKVGAESADKQYAEGKPDYADAFADNMTFRWDSQIGRGPDSGYMKDVTEAKRKHLLVKKSDAETSFYYMGTFDVIEARGDKKLDNNGKLRDITKVTMRMKHAVREDLLRYLESSLVEEAV